MYVLPQFLTEVGVPVTDLQIGKNGTLYLTLSTTDALQAAKAANRVEATACLVESVQPALEESRGSMDLRLEGVNWNHFEVQGEAQARA